MSEWLSPTRIYHPTRKLALFRPFSSRLYLDLSEHLPTPLALPQPHLSSGQAFDIVFNVTQ